NMELRMTAGQARELLARAAGLVQEPPPARTPTQPAVHDEAGNLRADKSGLAHLFTEVVRRERLGKPPERPNQRPGPAGFDPASSTRSARPNGLSPAQPRSRRRRAVTSFGATSGGFAVVALLSTIVAL